jgi:hypothetical protein
MNTLPSRSAAPGTLAPNVSAMPSSGWMRITSTLGLVLSTSVLRKSTIGGRRKWIDDLGRALGQRLPTRR